MLAHHPGYFDGLVGAPLCHTMVVTDSNVHIDTSPIQDLELEEYVENGPAFSLDVR